MSKSMSKKTVITAALPYANGSLHIGHLLEYIQTDIYVRARRLFGEKVLFAWASDMHGTPIEVNAKKAGKSPLEFASAFAKEHKEDTQKFHISPDIFYSTHSPENEQLANLFFTTLKEKGYIYTKETQQLYDQKAEQFLPDRFVKGECPKCQTPEQYGDVCENCGATYNASELINPRSILTNSIPLLKASTHYFFKLSEFTKQLKDYFDNEEYDIQPEIKSFVNGWLEKGLQDWCISRDEPYFGFQIPNSEKEAGKTKYFYVWLDAPIGYISASQKYLESTGEDFEDYWVRGNIEHVIGKDIIYFHFLFWPAMLMAMDYALPKIHVHGFITVNGKKMSKSRGTFFTAKEFHELYGAEPLRFYYASNLSRSISDVDLSLEDFEAVSNNVLLANLANFCYRTLSFAHKNYGEIKEVKQNEELTKKFDEKREKIKQAYLDNNPKVALKHILEIADLGNALFQDLEPWKAKDEKSTQAAIGYCANLAKNLAILSSPILPEFATKVAKAFGREAFSLEDLHFETQGALEKPTHFAQKIELQVNEETFPLTIRAGEITSVTNHPNADSLYLIKVDFGDEQRQVVAGLKSFFKPEELEGKTALFCTNIKKAKLRGEESQAMTLVAEDDEENLEILETSPKNKGSYATFQELKASEVPITFQEIQKIEMIVKRNQVFFDKKMLAINQEPIELKHTKDGARIT